MNRNKTKIDDVLFYVAIITGAVVALLLIWAAGYRTGQESIQVRPEIITSCVQDRGQEQECK